MPARPKNDSDVSEDESVNELMESASDDEESDEEESDDEEDSDDEESDDDDNEDLTLRLKEEKGDSNENESDGSGEEEDDDDEDEEDESDDDDESDEDEGKNRAAYKRVGMQGNDSDEESGDESDDEEFDSEDASDDDSDDSDEIATGKLLKSNKNQLKNVKKEADIKKEKLTNSKADKKPTAKLDKKLTPKLEKTPAIKVEKVEKTHKGKAQPEKLESKTKIPFEQTTEDLKEKYAKKRGKSLYIRFPKRLPTDQAELEKYIKGICNRVITVRRPRQPSARFCLVDFDNTEDCKKAYKEIRQVDVDGKRLHVQVPRTDSEDFIAELMDRRRKKLKDLRAKKKLRKALGPEKKEQKEKVFTSAITVRNIPINASVEEVKNHFPSAVEFKLFYAKKPQETNWAVVTLPTTQDASKAKRQNIVIGENKLSLSFVGQQKNKRKNKKQTPKSANKEEENKEGPAASEKSEKKKEKRKLDGGEDKKQVQSKKVKREIEDSPVQKHFGKNAKRQKFEKQFKKEHKNQNEQSKQQEGKQKNFKETKNLNNGNSKPFMKNEDSFEKKNKNNSFENRNKQQKFHNKGSEKINNEQKHDNKFGRKFGNKDKGFQNQNNRKNFKGNFPKGRNESKKGNFHMKAMRS